MRATHKYTKSLTFNINKKYVVYKFYFIKRNDFIAYHVKRYRIEQLEDD